MKTVRIILIVLSGIVLFVLGPRYLTGTFLWQTQCFATSGAGRITLLIAGVIFVACILWMIVSRMMAKRKEPLC